MDENEFWVKQIKTIVFGVLVVIALIAWVAGIIAVSYGINLSGLLQFSWAIDFVLIIALIFGFIHAIQRIYFLVLKIEDPEEEDPPKE